MALTVNDLPIGIEVYNGGDMANASHFGTITQHKISPQWGDQVQITPDERSDRDQPYWIPVWNFDRKYSGNGSTRFVTKAAYMQWRTAKMSEAFKAYAAR